MTSILDTLAAELRRLLIPLTDVVDNPNALDPLLAQIGAASDNAGGAALVSAFTTFSDLADQIEALLANPSPSLGTVVQVLETSRKAFSAVKSLSAPGGPAAALAGLGIDLADFLVAAHLNRWHPIARNVAVLLTLVEPSEELAPRPPVTSGNTVLRAPFTLDRFHFERLVSLIRDPVGTLKAGYPTTLATGADADALAQKLFPRVVHLLRALGVLCSFGYRPGDEAILGDTLPYIANALIVYVDDELAGATAEAGLIFTLSSTDRGGLGLVITPFGAITDTRQVGDWTLDLSLTADVQALAIGPSGVTLLAGANTVDVIGKAAATLPTPNSGPAFILGSPNGTRIEVGGAKLEADLDVSASQTSYGFSAAVSKAAIVIAPGDGDGFLQKVLPQNGARVDFDLGLAWTNTQGLKFLGTGSLDVTLPARVSVGGVLSIDSIHLGLHADDTGVSAECSATGGLSLGPVDVVVDRMGLLGVLSFPSGGGNLGSLGEGSLAFKPPSGLGISIDAAVVSGGGFLEHIGDEYSGALDVTTADIAIKGFGVVQTQLPGGVPGYSFVIALSAEFTPSIQLPFGFSLDGVGGIIGINRTISVDAVQSALWAHHLDGLLFPQDPIANAPHLLTALDSYFPAAPGRYLIGPMAKIGWGDGIVEGEIALLLELPEPLKLLLLGEIAVGVPMEKPQLELHISFDGGLDFGKKLAFFDATLHNSRIESFPIIGDLAFRDGWGDDGSFALGLGGFNPHFQPPASFPTLKRLTITIGSSVAQIEAQAYIALTANTLQFGARAEVTAGTGSFNVHGWLGIDALCERHPMSFIFDLSGGIDLRHGSDVLASVHLDGHLSGPTPWHISGEASLSLFLFDVSVHFDKTWGHGADALSLLDPLSLVLGALANASSFRSVLPAGMRTLVSLAEAPADANGALLLEPAGRLRIAQRVLPFGQPMTRFGGAPLGRTVQLSMDNVTAFTTTFQQPPAASEEFAPAQYFEFSDAEKLSLPSFSKFDAGVEIAGDAIDLGSGARSRAVVTPFTYETTIFDSVSKRRGKDYTLGMGALLAMNGRAMAQPTGLGRYAPPAGTPSRVTLAPDRWVIAGTDDLALRPDIGSDGSKVGAQLALKRFLAANADQRGQLQVVMFEEAA